MIDVSARYRLKALTCEQNAKDATEPVLRQEWTEVAIEWHALANRAVQHAALTRLGAPGNV
jgi:hypothetical protein